jgi:hypothetical protein
MDPYIRGQAIHFMLSCAIRVVSADEPAVVRHFDEDELVNVQELRTRTRNTTHALAILPHRCFTVNTHILRSGAGKRYSPIMIQESAKSFLHGCIGAKRQAGDGEALYIMRNPSHVAPVVDACLVVPWYCPGAS